MNHTPGISSWERARNSAAPPARHRSHSLLQVIPHVIPHGAVHRAGEPLVCINHCGGTKGGRTAPHPSPPDGPLLPMEHSQAGSPRLLWTCVQPWGSNFRGVSLQHSNPPPFRGHGLTEPHSSLRCSQHPRSAGAPRVTLALARDRGTGRWERRLAPCERGCCHRQAEREH